jgi:hypothetical protein
VGITSSASLYMATWFCRPVRLKSSSIKSSDTSAKYSWPSKEQKEEIQDSGVPEDVDIVMVVRAQLARTSRNLSWRRWRERGRFRAREVRERRGFGLSLVRGPAC